MRYWESASRFDELALTNPLTKRELDVVCLLADGLSNREIAHQLALALETVKWYNKQIYAKLGVRNRTEAAARAKTLGLLSDNSTDVAEATVFPMPQNNLPAQITSFVGRQREIAEVSRLLENTRLLTITGPAGSGKTRLALQVASEVSPVFKDGVFFVPFAPVTEVDNIIWAIAEHVDFQFHPQGKPLDQLLEYFFEKSALLVLDNFEHLLTGADSLLEILQSAFGVKILVTSRERLKLYGETNYSISGLELADVDDLKTTLRTESVELFAQRAHAVNQDLELTAEDWRHIAKICRLVEGLPLGIELAATWVDVLSPREIANEIEQSLDILETELRGTVHSQNSMRAAFDRSWNLLTEMQQAAFRRLSVFPGGFTRQAAEMVTGVNLHTLHSLANKSLLRYDPNIHRYEIHELLRQYASEQLERSGESDAITEAFATYFADFMADRWIQLKGRQQKTALLEIEADIENTRAAWTYWIQKRNVARLIQFFHSFWVIYDIRGWYPAGIELFERGAEMLRTVSSEEAEAALGWLLAAQGLCNVVGGIYTSVGGSRRGFALAKKGVQILQHLKHYDELMIVPLLSLFLTASHVNEIEIAFEAAQQCLDVATRIGDDWTTAKAKQFLTVQAVKEGAFERAERLAHEALSTFEERGDNWSKSVLCIEVLGLVEITQGQYERAKAWIEHGLAAAEEIAFKYSQQTAYWQLGYVAVLQDNYADAARYWHKALKVGENVLGSPTAIGFGGSGNTIEWGGRELIRE
jgi:predicted ATPase/DNA-binding CsgD family transcriptional regulator